MVNNYHRDGEIIHSTFCGDWLEMEEEIEAGVAAGEEGGH
jgi:hypothetical protein